MLRNLLALAVILSWSSLVWGQEKTSVPLQAEFAEVDITPKVKRKKTVYMAGFGQNRKAQGVHDPLMARVIVLKDAKKKIALVSVDLVGLFYDSVLRIREKLPGFDYVLVSSTHNHEGPDTLGLWGPHPFQSGVDPTYLQFVEKQVAQVVQKADKNLHSVQCEIGTAKGPELLHDSRDPQVKHDDLVAFMFYGETSKKPVGLVVQWNCHPETLGSKNTQISADYVTGTVEYLEKRFHCPVVYFTGTVGGLMTSLRVPVKDKKGNFLKDGTFEKTMEYGRLVGKLAEKALSQARPVSLNPISFRTEKIFLPNDNKLYIMGWQLGVFQRKAFLWDGSVRKAKPLPNPGKIKGQRMCLQTELGIIHLGQVDVACIPGEIYPELVLGKIQNPADPGADFPEAAKEPSIFGELKGSYKMLIGLANDEIGYILPKSQWDEKTPFCYGRKRPQYGEVNSLGAETGPLLCEAFQKLIK